ncbi:MAG TPA: hypothetical protein VFV18_08555 [Porticoccaceae bacterium]|nr:hypothetical protein [Porticoccaceae bacterium]
MRRRNVIGIETGLGIADVGIEFKAHAPGDGIATTGTAFPGGWRFELLAEVAALGHGFLQFPEFRILGFGKLGNRGLGLLASSWLGLGSSGGFCGGLGGRLGAGRGRRGFPALHVGLLCCGVALCGFSGALRSFLLRGSGNRLALLDFVVHRLSPMKFAEPVRPIQTAGYLPSSC